MSTYHKQEWVKVNVPVDKEIADLIRSLSEFPHLQTIESCQREIADADGKASAWIMFVYGEDWFESWEESAQFILGYLGPGLARLIGDSAGIMISVNSSSGKVSGELTVRVGTAKDVAHAISRLAHEYETERATPEVCLNCDAKLMYDMHHAAKEEERDGR